MGVLMHPKRLIFAVFVLVGLINLSGLAEYPMTSCDEAFLSDMSYNLVERGIVRTSILGNFLNFDQVVQKPSVLFLGGQGVFLHLFGRTPSSARLFSYAGWLVAVYFLFLIGRQLYDTEVGLIGAVLFATSLNTFWASHIAREEIWVITSGIGTIYYYLRIRKTSNKLAYILLGVIAALILEIHPNTIWFTLPLGFLVIHDNFQTPAGRFRILFAGSTSLLVAVSLLLFHLYPDPALSIRQLTWLATANDLNKGTLITRIPAQLQFFRDGYVLAFNNAVSGFTFYFLLGVLYALYRRSAADRLLISLWLLSVTAFTVLLEHKSPFYRPLWDPFAALFIGAAAKRFALQLSRLSVLNRLSSSFMVLLICTPLLTLNLAAQSWLSYKFRDRNYQKYASEILAVIPVGSHVFGSDILWYAFEGRNKLTATSYFAYATSDFGYTAHEIANVFRILNVDFAISDGAIGCSTDITSESIAYQSYLHHNCRLVAQISDRWFGADGPLGRGHGADIYDCGN